MLQVMKTRIPRLRRPRARRSKPSAVRSPRGSIAVETILVPTDFSPASWKALVYAVPLAQRFKAQLHLVHVNELADQQPLLAQTFNLEKYFGHTLRDRLQLLGADCALPIPPARCHVRNGKAYDQILREARRERADLIVIATHGYSGLKHFMLGSTAERIVRHAPCPVLAVREREHEFVRRKGGSKRGPRFALKKILVPTDFSEHSRDALQYAIALAKRFEARITLLHCIHPHYYTTSDEYAAYDLPRLMDSLNESAKIEMKRLVQETAFAGVPFRTEIIVGAPGREIADFAAKKSSDLIVTSTQGRTGLKRAWIGSTAEATVRFAKCPVLVVPRREKSK